MKEVDPFELENLLGRVTEKEREVPEEVKQVFSALVKTTLDLRDRQLREFGTIVTVEDVRIALDWLLDFFRSGQMPQTNHLLRRELFETWVANLQGTGN